MDCYTRRDRELPAAIRGGLAAGVSFALGLVILLDHSPVWAASYRWVDEKGRVVYSDVPPGNGSRGYVELSPQGRTLRQVESAEARAKRAAEANRLAEQARVRRERELLDKSLLATYRSPAEIELAKQRALVIEQELLDNLLARRKLSQTKGEAAYLDEQIVLRRQNALKVRDRFDADKARYTELTGKR